MIYRICGLSFSYPGGPTVLDGVSLELERGEILSVLGPNGAGKSTLLGCMLGTLPAPAGTVWLDGQDLSRMHPREIARLVGYVPQNLSPVFGYTVRDFVLMGRAPLIPTLGRPGATDRAAAEEALTQMGLAALADRPCTGISGGERQQASIARAIVRRPQVLLFDEPTAHLDFGNQLRTLRVLKELSRQGYTVVVTTHNPDHAILLGGRAAILDRNGRLTAGQTGELLREDLLCRVYQTDLKLRYVEELGRMVCLFPNL